MATPSILTIIYIEFEHFVERRRNINKIYTFALNSQVGAYLLQIL